MKILFAYFDFSTCNNQSVSPHLHDECPLNFSTKYNFHIKKEKLMDESNKSYQYLIFQEDKPENECIPEGFWGERIYNITAIVGDNGSGKSTILHSIIRATVLGLDPGVPFLLVFQDTRHDHLRLYCSDDKAFIWKGQKPYKPQSKYPESLMRTKCMLLDNTLSLSSYQLSDEYDSFVSLNLQDTDAEMEDFPESEKQFCNKSLFASIQFSNSMSFESLQQATSPASTVLYNHFCYESFQEVRFLFDDFYQDTLKHLKALKYPVPQPNQIHVAVAHVNRSLNDSHLPIGKLFADYFLDQDFISQIIVDAIFNLLHILPPAIRDSAALQFNENWAPFGEKPIIEDLLTTSYKIIDRLKTNTDIKKTFVQWEDFFAFVIEKRKNLTDIFQKHPQTLNSTCYQYIIDVQRIISDPDKQQCLISFLEKYIRICEPRYFLTFSSGMSSGEKNLLRMLTQFRYILRGPMYNTGLHRKVTCLQNRFPNHKPEKPYCNTLFLFLDEIDLTYHPEWQRIIISMLTVVLPHMFHYPYVPGNISQGGCYDIQIILATHSPLMLGDFPKSSVIRLNDHKSDNKTSQRSTFGENLYTILKDGFFMSDTIGEFARRKINSVAKWCADVRYYYEQQRKDAKYFDSEKEDTLRKKFDNHYKTMQLLPSGIIRNKILVELYECSEKLVIPFPQNDQDNLIIEKIKNEKRKL